jgi:hypothetical protein
MKEWLLGLDYEHVWKSWVAAFIVLESLTLWLGGERTFSHHIWAQFNVSDGWSFEKVALLLFTLWLVVHFTFKKLSWSPF